MAEVTTKKRGRPPKKQRPADADAVLLQHDKTDGGDDDGNGDIVPAPKARGRPASSSTRVSVTPTARTGRAKQTVGEVVGVATGEKPKASASAKKKAPAVVKTPDAATTPSTSKDRKTSAKSLASQQHDASATVAEGKAKAKPVAKNAEASRPSTTAAAPSTLLRVESETHSIQNSGQQRQQQPTTTPTTAAAGLVYPGQLSISKKILEHAKAFSRGSDRLQLDFLQLISQKEAAYTTTRHPSSPHAGPDTQETPTSASQTSFEADAIPVPADETTSIPPSIGRASTAAGGAASALTSDTVHPVSTQMAIPPLSPQQQAYHPHPPPPSFLSSPPLGTAQTQHQTVRAYSSTKALPMSTTIALAARQHSGPAGSKPSMPPRPTTIPPEVPHAPKLTELPLEQLKRDPRYRKASTRYTTFVVALPFAIVSSYFLWERYREHQAYLQKVRDARAKGPGTDDSASTPVSGFVPEQHDRE
ncbi:uncharacterized protein Z520_06677 [Fonsecaea multimorphosa CBS 102226]|uniref:Uncharacterized protein n=1 Tax=Fonsecaea multimorphosa CBS 102226 TaxID=1442371 RepID=A0A0D2K405_9EURO|nr:uncharacterized protein Z520_06677 [Fonsecaea multimorphosa CBS 102226]KIX97899.1 hypothetical protein Z520_06677 [Fonsecaea multimorphosa CBS 102226]OAL23669.1 hypothetical protein AYO22_06246 [Fonsecaea multimorphosa]